MAPNTVKKDAVVLKSLSLLVPFVLLFAVVDLTVNRIYRKRGML